MAPKDLHAIGFVSGVAMALAAGTPAQALTYTFGSDSPTTIGGYTPNENQAIFNLTVRKNRTVGSTTGVYTLREQFYLIGSFEVDPATTTISNVSLTLRAFNEDTQYLSRNTTAIPAPSAANTFRDPANNQF